MNLRTLKWLTIAIPIVFLATFDYLRHQIFYETLHTTQGFMLFLLATFAGIFAFSHAVFGLITRMQARIFRQNQELGAVAGVASALGQSLRLDDVTRIALDKSISILEADAGILCVLEEAHEELIATAQRGISEELFAQLRRAKLADHAMGAEVIRTGEPVAIGDAFTDPRLTDIAKREGFHSVLAIPLKAEGKAVGVLALARRGQRPFSISDAGLLSTIAGQVGMAIQNASLYAQVQSMAVAEERERIARELHDSVAQVLSYTQIKSAAARRFLQQGQTAPAADQLVQLERAAKDAYADAREAILGLRATVRPGHGFVAILREYLDRFAAQAGLAVEVLGAGPDDELRLSPETEHHVLRIIQEALANIRKHAEASHAWIQFEPNGQYLQVAIDDDGKGFNPSQLRPSLQPRFGLHMMRERAETFGGTLAIQARPGGGSRIIVTVPRNGGTRGGER